MRHPGRPTVLGIQLTSLLVGAIVIENVFVLHGLGRLFFQSVGNRDCWVVQELVMLLTASCWWSTSWSI